MFNLKTIALFKKIAIAALALSALTSVAHAEPMVGKKLKVTQSYGQPFCTETDQLKEFLVAAMTEDKDGIVAILKEGNCAMLQKGTSVSVIEDIGDKDDEMHGIKIRAMNKNVSMVGYTLSVGMQTRK